MEELMNNYFTVDMHTHTREDMEGLLMYCDCMGTPDELLSIMKAEGIDTAVVLPVSPLTGFNDDLVSDIKQRNVQKCLMYRNHEEFIVFINLHPRMGKKEMLSELMEKVENFNARGIKLHPEVGCYYPNDESLWPVYEKATDLGLPILSHGGGLFHMGKEFTIPSNFEGVLENFPDLTLIIAHMGIWSNFNKYKAGALKLAERFSNVYFDISDVINDGIIEFVRKIGIDRVMFGSDYPGNNPGNERKKILNMEFTESEKAAILGGNSKRILKL